MYKRKVRVLFVCTGNSARSQMAEAWARARGGDWLEARSAGVTPATVHPHTITVMREVGIALDGHYSKPLTEELLAWADVVITVCAHADVHCPALPPAVQKRHWPLPDPAAVAGEPAAQLAAFRAVREQVRLYVDGLVGGIRLLARAD